MIDPHGQVFVTVIHLQPNVVGFTEGRDVHAAVNRSAGWRDVTGDIASQGMESYSITAGWYGKSGDIKFYLHIQIYSYQNLNLISPTLKKSQTILFRQEKRFLSFHLFLLVKIRKWQIKKPVKFKNN